MVRSRSLFPELAIRPSASLDEPAIWIKRIVIVDKPNPPIRVIRPVSFRRGLNIVCTERRMPFDQQPVGHSVGKSLLVRIIRYCLGEEHYCTRNQLSTFRMKLEHGYAFAAFRVAGKDWVVARPLGLESGYEESWCVQSGRLKALLPKETRRKYREFVNAVEEATRACYAEINLPKADRRANWKDLLGWLSRDQDCAFAHHAEWRITESEAGPRALTKEDAHLVMRMALGLVGLEEIGLMEEHNRLTTKTNDTDATVKRYQTYVAETEVKLRQSVKDLAEIMPERELFGDTCIEISNRKIKSLTGLLEDPKTTDEKGVAAAQESLDKSLKAEGSLEATIEDRTTAEEARDVQLKLAEKQDSAAFMKSLNGLLWKCAYFKSKDEAANAGCPGQTIVDQAVIAPMRLEQIRVLQDELAIIRRQREDARARLDLAQRESERWRKQVVDLRRQVNQNRDGISQKIGLWQARRDEGARYVTACRELTRVENVLKSLRKEVATSLAAQADVRTRLEQQKAELAACYTAVLKSVITPNAEGQIEIDGNGIRPQPNEVVANTGSAIRSYANVLSYDLACLTASICGIGHLPRLWMHDSPRQSDSEEELYYAVMRFVENLEKGYPRGRRPAFQYILTTTSLPPLGLNCSPYVRLRLNARTAQGKLLRRDFG